MESCSNCRFSLEEWKYLGEEPEYAEEYDADTFYCRRYPPTIHLGVYAIRAYGTDSLALSARAVIDDENRRFSLLPQVGGKWWCGEWKGR